MQNRTDPSSISLGRAVRQAQADAAQARAEVEALKTSLPNSQAMQAAAIAGETVQAQRRNAKRMLADRSTTLDQLNAIDASVLTPAMAEQLRMNRNDALMAQEMNTPVMLQVQSPAALQRFDNWRQQVALNAGAPVQEPSINFGFTEQQTPYQRWLERQNSPAGRRVAARSLQLEQEQALVQRRQNFTPPEPDRSTQRQVGGFMKDLNQ